MSRAPVVLLLLALAACGGNSDVPAAPDAAPDASFGCYSDEGGTDMGLTLGHFDGETFTELADGDDTLLVLGAQGFYMLQLEPRAGMSVDGDSVCLQCQLDVSASEAGYPGDMQVLEPYFDQVEANTFGTIILVILGSATEPEPYADSRVDISLSCQGHGYSGVVERQDIKLTIPPDAE
ncbi:MAG TPA: hypothetical protein VMZ28_28755 [Kofleriaceae bacterium]|nr:hypothetical protein [Kofleriaceae bacterium]